MSEVSALVSRDDCGACSSASAASPRGVPPCRRAAITEVQKRVGSLSCSSSVSQATWPVLSLAQAESSVVLPKPAEAESNVKGTERLCSRTSSRRERGRSTERTGGMVTLVTSKSGSGMRELLVVHTRAAMESRREPRGSLFWSLHGRIRRKIEQRQPEVARRHAARSRRSIVQPLPLGNDLAGRVIRLAYRESDMVR